MGNRGSFFIEFSHDKNFYFKRKGSPGFSPLEEKLFRHQELYEKRWNQLIKKGVLE